MASFWGGPPPTMVGKKFSAIPKDLWSTKAAQSDWKPGSGGAPPIFIEGPCTDTAGNLYIVDIPGGRILKCAIATETWSELAEWGGEPNGLAMRSDGMLVVADYKEGLLLCHPLTGKIEPLYTRRNLERLKGPNDLVIASNGDICQTGMSDPTGLVYRLSPTGKLDCLLSNGPSPNGLVLSPDESVLYVAMTRENSVWRCPLHADGTTTKVAKFFQTFGVAGPDGLTVDAEGNLFITHSSLGAICVVDRDGLPVAKIVPPDGKGNNVTNCIFGSTPQDRNRLYFVESRIGRVSYVDWHCDGVQPLVAPKT